MKNKSLFHYHRTSFSYFTGQSFHFPKIQFKCETQILQSFDSTKTNSNLYVDIELKETVEKLAKHSYWVLLRKVPKSEKAAAKETTTGNFWQTLDFQLEAKTLRKFQMSLCAAGLQ